MAGVGVQEGFIVLFTILAGRFQYQMNQVELIYPSPYPWRRLLYTLYVALALITVRIIFRLVEYTDGEYSHVASYEAYFYCLEALPMIISLVIFNIVHPGFVLVGPSSEFPKKVKKSREEKKADTERKKAQRKHSFKGTARNGDAEFGAGSEMDGFEMRVQPDSQLLRF